MSNMITQLFSEYNFPPKLQPLFTKVNETYANAFIVIDDSGSMGNCDGKLYDFRQKEPSPRLAPRSDELAADFELIFNFLFHSNIQTKVSFLNKANIVLNTQDDLATALQRLRMEPSGATPICGKLNDIYDNIVGNRQNLENAGKRALLLISSDGEATDGNLTDSIRRFKGLPVTIVVRICSSDKKILNYWNNIEKDVEMGLDVIDDIESEAKQIEKLNNFFRYSYSIHILRQMGVTILDNLDEKTLNKPEKANLICKVLNINPSVFDKKNLIAANFKVFSIVDKKSKDIISVSKIFGWFD